MSKPDTIKIDEVEYVRKDSIQPTPKSLEQQRSENPHWPWVLGKKYMVRTVTYHDHGTLIGVTEHELVFEKAAWIADSGRWYDFILGRKPPIEVEPFDQDQIVIIGRGAFADATPHNGTFTEQK